MTDKTSKKPAEFSISIEDTPKKPAPISVEDAIGEIITYASELFADAIKACDSFVPDADESDFRRIGRRISFGGMPMHPMDMMHNLSQPQPQASVPAKDAEGFLDPHGALDTLITINRLRRIRTRVAERIEHKVYTLSKQAEVTTKSIIDHPLYDTSAPIQALRLIEALKNTRRMDVQTMDTILMARDLPASASVQLPISIDRIDAIDALAQAALDQLSTMAIVAPIFGDAKPATTTTILGPNALCAAIATLPLSLRQEVIEKTARSAQGGFVHRSTTRREAFAIISDVFADRPDEAKGFAKNLYNAYIPLNEREDQPVSYDAVRKACNGLSKEERKHLIQLLTNSL